MSISFGTRYDSDSDENDTFGPPVATRLSQYQSSMDTYEPGSKELTIDKLSFIIYINQNGGDIPIKIKVNTDSRMIFLNDSSFDIGECLESLSFLFWQSLLAELNASLAGVSKMGTFGAPKRDSSHDNKLERILRSYTSNCVDSMNYFSIMFVIFALISAAGYTGYTIFDYFNQSELAKKIFKQTVDQAKKTYESHQESMKLHCPGTELERYIAYESEEPTMCEFLTTRERNLYTTMKTLSNKVPEKMNEAWETFTLQASSQGQRLIGWTGSGGVVGLFSQFSSFWVPFCRWWSRVTKLPAAIRRVHEERDRLGQPEMTNEEAINQIFLNLE